MTRAPQTKGLVKIWHHRTKSQSTTTREGWFFNFINDKESEYFSNPLTENTIVDFFPYISELINICLIKSIHCFENSVVSLVYK